MKGTEVFLLGALLGFAVAAFIYYLFSSVIQSALSNAAVSGVTLLGIGFALGGYLMRWRGDNSRGTYFVMGGGVVIVVVAFAGAGVGVSPYIPS